MGLIGGRELIYDSKSKSENFHVNMDSTEYNPSMSSDRTVEIYNASYQNIKTSSSSEPAIVKCNKVIVHSKLTRMNSCRL
jgi:hypothetical protein